MVEGLFGRQRELWRPLLVVAESLGTTWPDKARRAIQYLTLGRITADEPSYGLLLLADLRDHVFQLGDARLSTEKILQRLHGIDESPWANEFYGRPLDNRGLAKLLRPFDVQGKTIREGAGTPRGYELYPQLCDAFERYLPEPKESGGNSETEPQQKKPSGMRLVADVADVAVAEDGAPSTVSVQTDNNKEIVREGAEASDPNGQVAMSATSATSATRPVSTELPPNLVVADQDGSAPHNHEVGAVDGQCDTPSDCLKYPLGQHGPWHSWDGEAVDDNHVA